MPLRLGIFPASGGLATSVYTHLLTTLSYPAQSLVLVCRYPSKIPSNFLSAGVTTRQASFESTPADLTAAFTGIDVLLLVSYPSHDSTYRIDVQIPALDAAVKGAGVRHVFYSSLAFAGGEENMESSAEVMQAHLATERHLRELESSVVFEDGTRFTWTSVREGLYAESFPIYLAFLVPALAAERGDGAPETMDIRIPHPSSGGGGIPWVARDELGEATARLMVAYANDPPRFPYTNRNVLLTGPKLWTLGETVAALGRVFFGKEDAFRIVECSVDEYVAQDAVKEKFGEDAKLARTWATAWPAIQAGETGIVTQRLSEILGRDPTGFEEVIRGLKVSMANKGKG